MNHLLNLARKSALIAGSIAASLAVLPLEANADTFSFSQGEITFSNTSQPAQSLDTFADTDAFTTASGAGAVDAQADATAEIFPDSGTVFTETSALGFGSGYFGTGTGRASFKSIFSLAADQVFSFDFTSKLNLFTFLENPATETATAKGKVQFSLFNDSTNELLDSFGLFGSLNGATNNSPISYQGSSFVNLSSFLNTLESEAPVAIASAQIQGTYRRTFSAPTTLRVEGYQESISTAAEVPEPSYVLGSFAALAMIFYLRKRRSTKLEHESEALATTSTK